MKGDLSEKDARAKVEKLLSNSKTVFVATNGSHGHPNIRAMTPLRVVRTDEVWFATSLESSKVLELIKDPHAAIYGCSQTSGAEFRLWGSIETLDDRESRKLVWCDELKKRYAGVDDPGFRVLKFTTVSGMFAKEGRSGTF